MGIANFYNLVRRLLWEFGGILADLELGLDALGAAGYVPCPCKVAAPRQKQP